MMYEGLPKIIMLFIQLNESTYEYIQGKSWHEGVKVAVSNIQPTAGQWNAAPGHLMTKTLCKTGHRPERNVVWAFGLDSCGLG